MNIECNATHDPQRISWVASANEPGCDFPIQNLPFGLFSTSGGPRGGVALGDQIIDLGALSALGVLGPLAQAAAEAASGATLAPLLGQPVTAVSALRCELSDLFREGGRADRGQVGECLVSAASAIMHMPLKPTAFTDFCSSIDHIKRMAGSTGVPLKPAWTHLPVAYNGRASSVSVDKTPVKRPRGQYELPPGSGVVRYGPEPLLDFELEFGAWLRAGSKLGHTLTIAEAESLLFGCCLVNDWSARGIQFFEAMLGPHLGKSFLTTISPWIVTMEALAPFRIAARGRDEGEVEVPAHLFWPSDRAHGAIQVALTADLQTASGVTKRIVSTRLEALYWTLAQMVAHQASTGAPLEAGDLVATGTVSGPRDDEKACMAEITQRGATPIVFDDGSKRVMLEDGDTLTIRGLAHAEGYVSIGFGSCAGTIVPAEDASQ